MVWDFTFKSSVNHIKWSSFISLHMLIWSNMTFKANVSILIFCLDVLVLLIDVNDSIFLAFQKSQQEIESTPDVSTKNL